MTGAGGLSTTATSFDYVNTDTHTDLGAAAPINAGDYSVTATYAGDANHTSSVSSVVNFTISNAPLAAKNVSGATIYALPGQSTGLVIVATFTDPQNVLDSTAPPYAYGATIVWGDGSPNTTVTTTADSAGEQIVFNWATGLWDVLASHTYATVPPTTAQPTVTVSNGISGSPASQAVNLTVRTRLYTVTPTSTAR